MATPRLHALLRGIVFAGLCLSSPARADVRLTSLLAHYFIRVHHALPLSNNPAVKSGEVIHMPDEGVLLGRDRCFHLAPVKYRSNDAEFIDATSAIVGKIGAAIPAEALGQIEAAVGSKVVLRDSILLDPFNTDQPLPDIAVLSSSDAPECTIVKRIWQQNAPNVILVTGVLHGSLNSWAEMRLDKNVEASGELAKKVREILGAAPSFRVAESDAGLWLETSRSPEPRSLAVLSAAINPEEMTRIYLRYRLAKGKDLEAAVQEYLTGEEPGVLESARLKVIELLHELELWRGTVGALYSAIFSGPGAVPAVKVVIPQEQWDAFAVVAAAHIISQK